MKNKIMVSALLLALQSNSVSAGVWGTTIHSRANCLNNESITWWANNPNWWHVISVHFDDYNNTRSPSHTIDTRMGYTWRQAAVCWGEGVPGRRNFVVGYHYYLVRGVEYLDDNTRASGCTLYNGWWG
jgi:hypothetical protein